MSTDETTAGDANDLVQRLAEREREVQALSARVDGQSRQIDILTKALAGEAGLYRLEDNDENTTLLDQLGELQNRLADVEAHTPDPSTTEYENLSRQDKIAAIRRGLVEEAKNSGGTAAGGYREVKQRFDGKPADSHCYDLMEDVANAPGFTFGKLPPSYKKRIKVDLAEVEE